MRRKLSIERIRELKKEPSYLEKIEKNRLIHPCSRQIDMRSKVDAKCFEYNHHGITHYLDSRSKDLFYFDRLDGLK